VKITDFPIIQILKAQNAGEDTFENPIRYASGVSTSSLALNGQNLASVSYANSLSFGAVAGASENTAGFVELATGKEAASSTLTGTTGSRLALSTAISTSTKPSSGNYIPVTDANGSLINFLQFTSGTTTIASSSVKYYTASSTWSKPANLKYIVVEAIGGGGGGGGVDSGASPDGAGGGGGGGGAYCKRFLSALDLSGTTTVAVTIGARADSTPARQALVHSVQQEEVFWE
jgi:hypothetical protein